MKSLHKAVCCSIYWAFGSSVLLSLTDRWNKTADMRKCGGREPPLLVQWLLLVSLFVIDTGWISKCNLKVTYIAVGCWSRSADNWRGIGTFTVHPDGLLCLFMVADALTANLSRLKRELEIWLIMSVLYAVFVWRKSHSSCSGQCLHVLKWFVCPNVVVQIKVFWSPNSTPWSRHRIGSIFFV
jgi:hypothetical protein